MSQSRIDNYFPGVTQHQKQSQFLALPRSIRKQIYEAADIGPGYFIDLNSWARTPAPSIDNSSADAPIDLDDVWLERDWRKLRNPPYALILSLLLVCKAVSLEVQEIFYSQNYFAIAQRSPGGLRTLANLSTRAIQNLRFLLVYLTPCACIVPQCDQNHDRFPHDAYSFQTMLDDATHPAATKGKHDRQLGDISRSDKNILEQWKRIWVHFATYVSPGKLSLYVVCHVRDRSIAEQVTGPLLQLPRLRDCSLCLGPNLHPARDELQKFAKMAVKCLTTYEPVDLELPFRFLDLPRELQLQILESSPLELPSPIRIRSGKYTNAWLPHSCDKEYLTLNTAVPFRGARYFCTRQATAFYTRCDPGMFRECAGFFRVSKAFADLATEVFCSKNSFVVGTWHGTWYGSWLSSVQGGPENYQLGESYGFLLGASSRALRCIRQLCIQLPPIKERESEFFEAALDWPCWQESIQLLASRAVLSRLTLTIEIGDHCPSSEPGDSPREPVTEEYERRQFEIYKRVIRPLSRLQGLKALFIFIPSPFGFGSNRKKMGLHFERELERMVMGPSYDACALGKPKIDKYSRSFLWNRYELPGDFALYDEYL